MHRYREIRRICRDDCSDFVLQLHYAKRWPSISFAWGLFVDGVIEGVVTYGTPPSAPLKTGIAGKQYASNILELNRLCLRSNHKNDASWLVSKSIRELKKIGNFIIVSFADIGHGHSGVVYQAANFLYSGLSAKRTDWKVKGKEHLHGQTVADEFRGHKNRSEMMRQKYGDDFYLEPRSRKHRYIMIVGDRKFTRDARSSVNYQTFEYPKPNEKVARNAS